MAVFRVVWDKEVNGILLVESSPKESLVKAPRPVFFEELDLLGFNEYWEYPRCEEPLLWAVGRRYFYKGELVAEARGGNIYEPPKLKLHDEGLGLKLEPVPLDVVIDKNEELLRKLEKEALFFVKNIYERYNKQGNVVFTVSYSGGKDSQVVLELVTRIIPADELVVVFSDTTMELPQTYECVEKTKEEYIKKYPQLRFLIAKPPRDALEFWKEFGPPSRIHRWCSPVLKTAPFYRKLKDHLSCDREVFEIIVFEGVRIGESGRRASHYRKARDVVWPRLINIRPILLWNSTEVFLYIFSHTPHLLNSGYRYGLARVGCKLCPFSSEWGEFVSYRVGEGFEEFLRFLENYAKNMGLVSENALKAYIARGEWKKRAGGKGVENTVGIEFLSYSPNKVNVIVHTFGKDGSEFAEWAKILGDVMFLKRDSASEIKLKIKSRFEDSKTLKCNITRGKNTKIAMQIEFPKINSDQFNRVKKIIYKFAYCVRCRVCEVVCPTSAIDLSYRVRVDSDKCIHCGACLDFVSKGCLVAKSIDNNMEGMGKMKDHKRKGGLDRYSTFGLREEWLRGFFKMGDEWWGNNPLGPKQVVAMVRWLVDGEVLVSKTKIPTETGKILISLFKKDKFFVWLVLWTNFYYNSKIVTWYCDEISWGKTLSIKDLKNKALEFFEGFNEGTVLNPLLALINMFEKSPLGAELRIGVVSKERGERFVSKEGVPKINPYAVAYSIYKTGEKLNRSDFTVSEFYKKDFPGGPYKLFGIPRDEFVRILRGLQEDKEKIVSVDFAADLENIFLNENLTSMDILKIAKGRLK